jgi:hypothetical protein
VAPADKNGPGAEHTKAANPEGFLPALGAVGDTGSLNLLFQPLPVPIRIFTNDGGTSAAAAFRRSFDNGRGLPHVRVRAPTRERQRAGFGRPKVAQRAERLEIQRRYDRKIERKPAAQQPKNNTHYKLPIQERREVDRVPSF